MRSSTRPSSTSSSTAPCTHASPSAARCAPRSTSLCKLRGFASGPVAGSSGRCRQGVLACGVRGHVCGVSRDCRGVAAEASLRCCTPTRPRPLALLRMFRSELHFFLLHSLISCRVNHESSLRASVCVVSAHCGLTFFTPDMSCAPHASSRGPFSCGHNSTPSD